MPHSAARVILGEVLILGLEPTEVTAYVSMPNLLTTTPPGTSFSNIKIFFMGIY